MNVVCSLLLMLRVRDIGIRICAARSSAGKLLAAATDAKTTWLGRLKGNGRRLVVAAVIAVGVPMGASFLSHFDGIGGTVEGFLEDHFPPFLLAKLTLAHDYCSNIVVGALQAYVENAIGEVTRLWLKFFIQKREVNQPSTGSTEDRARYSQDPERHPQDRR